VTKLHPQALGSLFVASYDWQCYGGGVRTRFHKEGFSHTTPLNWVRSPVYDLCADRLENTTSKISSVVARISVSAETVFSGIALQLAPSLVLLFRLSAFMSQYVSALRIYN
jgi:hypothetical protein